MAQFQPQVPDPLIDDLPAFLTPGGMTTPTIRVLLGVFIGERIFKCAAMQIERHHIGSGESSLRQRRQKQFVDDSITFDAHSMLSRSCWMGRHHDATALPVRTHCHLRTVIEGAHQSTFRTAELLIWRKGEPKLDLGVREQLIVFAAHDKWESSQVREGGSGAILPVESQERALCWDLMGREISLDLGHGSA